MPLLSALVFLLTPAARAQITPQCASGCVGVSVTPDGGAITQAPNTGPFTAFFTVENTGTLSATYTFTCSRTGGITCGTVTPKSATIAGLMERGVQVTYSVGSTSGSVRLTATGPDIDQGYYNVTVFQRNVSVTPDGGSTAAKPANTSGYSEQFTVTNTGTSADTYTITCGGSSNVTCSGTSTGSVTLAAGASTEVPANYSVGAAGTGTLSLTAANAAVSNGGSYSITVVTRSPQAPGVAIGPVNPGATVERSLCLTVALSEAAASECGDLRVVHPLPATRTLNKRRVPTLLYNSAHAHPYPWVAAVATLPLISTVPDSVTAALTIGSVVEARGKWTGPEWTPGQARRVVLTFDGIGDSTGIYTYTLEMRTWFGATSKPTAVTGSLAIVNRTASAFGAGWWLAGLEQLDVATMTWTGGDGSVRQYVPATGLTNVWVTASVDHPDTLKKDGSGNYTRYDKDSVRVKFNSTGQHISTTNRQGRVTAFAYTSGRLTSITLPPSGSGKVYQFTYDANNKLQTVAAPKPTATLTRTVTVTMTSGRITAIRDPDNTTVQYAYDPAFANLLTSRTARNGAVTTFGFDGAKKVRQASLNMGSGQSPIVSTVVSLESRGLPGGGTPSSIDTALAYAKLDGPRAVGDTTLFWLDHAGAPRKIQDPLGNVTQVTRGDTRWPALVTRVRYANGQILGATYDTRGNLTSLTDSSSFNGTKYATTSYQWDPKWDAVTKITQPEGDNLTFAYDATTGNRLWQQDGRGQSTRVTFGYNTLNQVTSITRPGTPAETVGYDGLGNVASTTTPKGYQVIYNQDGIGRDTLINAPIDTLASSTRRQTQRIYLDLGDRDTLTVTAGPTMSASAPAETLLVRKHHTTNGQVDTLSRWAKPNAAAVGTITTKWRYDLAGRRIAEVSPDGQVDSTEYDLAGNVLSVIPRRGAALKVVMQYDEMNRLIKRTIPAANYGSQSSIINWSASPYNKPSNYAAYTVPGDVQDFAYDAVGHLTRADNADARIRRSYYPNGLLQGDTIFIRAVASQDFSQHVYTIGYQYDLNGRRKLLQFPAGFNAPRRVTGIPYSYDPGFGALVAVNDVTASRYDLTYNARGEPGSVTWPNGYQELLAFDGDGRVAADTIINVGGTTAPRIGLSPVRAMGYLYDARDRILFGGDPTAYKDTLTLAYSGLGFLVQSTFSQRGKYPSTQPARYVDAESFKYDGLGNRFYSTAADSLNSTSIAQSQFTSRTATYQAGTGRLSQEVPVSGVINYTYDLAGNLDFVQAPGSPPYERKSYYGADGKLRAVDVRNASSPTPTLSWWKRSFDEYRYDALGRRVWMRSQKDCIENTLQPGDALDCKTSVLRRTIWDGDLELAEIQMPGGPGDGTYWENDTSTVLLPSIMAGGHSADQNPFYGRVLYVHGTGLDRPLAIYRLGYSFATDSAGFPVTPEAFGNFTIIPFWNQQGDPVLGAFDGGEGVLCRTSQSTSVRACAKVLWPAVYSAYDRQRGLVRDSWNGSLLENRRDQSGLQYKRNRFYDPAAGRFTQEDPIGLAGGINLYGFANGDPVNFGDPFGLMGCQPWWSCLVELAKLEWHGIVAGSDPTGLTPFDPDAGQGQLGYGLGKLLSASAGAGRVVIGGRALSGSALASAAEAADNAFVTAERLGHIVRRHGFGSLARNAGKFAEDSDIQSLISQALRSDASLIRPGANGRMLFERTFDAIIGVNSAGSATNRLRVVIEPSGRVVTAFPF